MKISKIRLIHFKRFDDLTIDLGAQPSRIVALVGPNGVGKSCVFDAFAEKIRDHRGTQGNPSHDYLSKLKYSKIPSLKDQVYKRSNSIFIEKDHKDFDAKSFYVRTAYRYNSELNIQSLNAKPKVEDDPHMPGSTNLLDQRLTFNYEAMVGEAQEDFWSESEISNKVVKEKLIKPINDVLVNVIGVKIKNLGNISTGQGKLFFEKDDSENFPYELLSAGEKEVVDMVIDLVVKTRHYTNTVYCIDEPELHLNTSIQRKLIIEIEKLIPKDCQLWIATHSVGFLRALQEDLNDKTQILEFSEDYFTGSKTMVPMLKTRKNWERIFKTALEDLTGLIAPKKIIYCEGSPKPKDGREFGFDAIIYNKVFEVDLNDTLFVSAGGGGDVARNASIALTIMTKALPLASISILKDRDDLTDVDREELLKKDANLSILKRREIENYLCDQNVIEKYSNKKGVTFDVNEYKKIISDIEKQDLKENSFKAIEDLKSLVGFSGKRHDFLIELASFLTGTDAYTELKSCIRN